MDRQPLRLFLAGQVLAPDEAPGADALLAAGERVVAVGPRDALRAVCPGVAEVDFGDAVIVPGFNDAHQHPSLVAADLLRLDLSVASAPSRAAIRAAVAQRAADTPPGEWIRGSRYDESRLADGPLTRADLDAVAPDHPVVVSHVSAHHGVVNSRALAAAGIDEASEPPPGGVLGRDSGGRLNGVLAEQAFFDFAYSCLARGQVVAPTPPIEQWLGGLRLMWRRLAAAGLTSVTDALVGPEELMLFQLARERGELPLRVNMLITHPTLAAIEDLGMRSGFGDDRLRFEAIKVILDGSVSAGTCLLATAAGHEGVQVLDTGTLRALIVRARRAGCRLAVHANGDRAIELLLDELDRADHRIGLSTAAGPDRIEHCSVVRPDLTARIAARGMAVTPFGAYAHFHGAKLRARHDAERLDRMFAHRSLLDAGVTVAGASDHPCGPFEPLLAMRSCVTRRSAEGPLLGPAQRITAREALSVYTTGSAEASGQGADKGRLAPGHLADFAVLGASPLRVPAEELSDIPVLATFVGAAQIWPES